MDSINVATETPAIEFSEACLAAAGKADVESVSRPVFIACKFDEPDHSLSSINEQDGRAVPCVSKAGTGEDRKCMGHFPGGGVGGSPWQHCQIQRRR